MASSHRTTVGIIIAIHIRSEEGTTAVVVRVITAGIAVVDGDEGEVVGQPILAGREDGMMGRGVPGSDDGIELS